LENTGEQNNEQQLKNLPVACSTRDQEKRSRESIADRPGNQNHEASRPTGRKTVLSAMSSLDERKDPSLAEPSARVAHTGAKTNPAQEKISTMKLLTSSSRQDLPATEKFEMGRCTPARPKIEQKINLETKNHCNRV
jgi:hypothetical protein